MKRVVVAGFSNHLAGTEAVIKNYVSALKGRISFDMLVTEEPTNYMDLFDGDNRYFVLPNKRRHPLAHTGAVSRHFAEHHGEYDAVWSNLNILNNLDALRLGARYGIPKRILHAHNSQNNGALHQRVLCAIHKPTFQGYLTDRWACSREAGDYFFPNDDYVIIPNAINEAEYAFDAAARTRVRRELGVGEDALLVGAVGRLVPEKNYGFLVDLWPRVLEASPEARLCVVGTGELEGELRQKVESAGLGDHVLLPGGTRDMASFYSAFDVFAMPSLFEGLPVSLLEAQFNGLPCVLSDQISRESVVTEGLAMLSLSEPEQWADALVHASREGVRFNERADTYRLVVQADRVEALFKEGL